MSKFSPLALVSGVLIHFAFATNGWGDRVLDLQPNSERPARTRDPGAIAQQQKARSFRLQAAFSLAKLYQSTGRTADARAVLAPALEGFSPMPEFPELAEAQMLLVLLA